MSKEAPKDPGLKIHFEPSTIESIDRSVMSFLEEMKLFTETNSGWREVPVIWGTAERSFQTKNNKDIRDKNGMLIMPLITVERKQISKPLASKGVFQGNIPPHFDEQGSALPVSRVLYQEKTMKFANADAKKLTGQLNYPRCNGKIVYRTVSAPMPVNVEVTYEITLRTEYQQQMNELMQPFITSPGTINFVPLRHEIHRYEGFIQEEYTQNNNLSDFSSEERKFETKISMRVVGYLVGQGDNQSKPQFAVRENAVEVKIPRERISLAEIPEHKHGSYYGLAGVAATFSAQGCPFPYLFNNVPAAGKGSGQVGTVGSGGTAITPTVFRQMLADNLIIREVLKLSDAATPNPPNVLTLSSQYGIKENSELLFVNGLVQAVGAANDYTISGKTITLTENLLQSDSVYITYIVG